MDLFTDIENERRSYVKRLREVDEECVTQKKAIKRFEFENWCQRLSSMDKVKRAVKFVLENPNSYAVECALDSIFEHEIWPELKRRIESVVPPIRSMPNFGHI